MNIIMYHYVRPRENSRLRYLDLEDFKTQLAFFEKEFGFLSIDEFRYNIENKISSNKVLLTFDDGLKDHYNYVLPELVKRKISGFFFIPSAILTTRNILNVHKIHYLLSKLNSNELLNSIKKKIDISFFSKVLDEEIYSYSEHDKNELLIKRLLNYSLKHEFSNSITDELLSEYSLRSDLFDKLYLNKNELSELSSFGQIIGSHAYDHQVLSSLSKEEQFSQLDHSMVSLEKYMPDDFKTFCYPYGYKMSYNDETLKILDNFNIDYAFVFDNKKYLNSNNLEISRLDCNIF